VCFRMADGRRTRTRPAVGPSRAGHGPPIHQMVRAATSRCAHMWLLYALLRTHVMQMGDKHHSRNGRSRHSAQKSDQIDAVPRLCHPFRGSASTDASPPPCGRPGSEALDCGPPAPGLRGARRMPHHAQVPRRRKGANRCVATEPAAFDATAPVDVGISGGGQVTERPRSLDRGRFRSGKRPESGAEAGGALAQYRAGDSE
jgi:hypothetical protein